MSNTLNIIIPMAGWGTRMRPQTWSKPKPLVGVAGQTALDYLMDMSLSSVHIWVNYKSPLSWKNIIRILKYITLSRLK